MADRPILFSTPMVRALLDGADDWDYSDPDIAYLLGVIHGDGHVSERSIQISVSHKEPDYVAVLIAAFNSIGLSPKIYRQRTALRIDVHNARLARALRLTKSGGLWTIPEETHIASYFAGIIDTDGHLTKQPTRALVITQKRGGNLRRLGERIALAGLRTPPVTDRTATYNGKPYDIEQIKWPALDQIEWIASKVRLRHPRKAARLAAMADEVAAIRSHVPLWRLIAEWIAAEPRDIDEIMERWNLTKRQADSVIGNIKANMDLEIIPPPRVLTKYRIRRPI